MEIKYYRHNKIDLLKWDRCIASSLNSSSYAYSWYLDIVSEGWEAIIVDDYEIVMPLPAVFKYGSLEIRQPRLTPFLGIFTKKILSTDIIEKIISEIPGRYRYINLVFNKFNPLPENYKRTKTHIYQYDLIEQYRNISLSYSKYIKQLLDEFKNNNYSINIGINPGKALNFLRNTGYLKDEQDVGLLRRVMAYTISRNISRTICLYDEKNSLVGISFFIFSNYVAHCLFASFNQIFNDKIGIAAFIDYFFSNYAERNLTFMINGFENGEYEQEFSGMNLKKYHYESITINKLSSFRKLFFK